MIEVEIRGKLTEEEYQSLKKFLQENGQFSRQQNREMFLLIDYPGFDRDPTTRSNDIRLRNTDGFCEIMLKHKLNDGNSGRREVSLPLKDNNLEKAREVIRALGCKKAIQMHREKEVYAYQGMEWEVVNCPPKNVKYFEIEKEAKEEKEVEDIKRELTQAAEQAGLHPLNNDEMREFLYWLDDEVNQIVEI